mgnify:CR=1 FL=1
MTNAVIITFCRRIVPAMMLAAALIRPEPLPAQTLDLSLPDLGDPSTSVLPAEEEARIGAAMMREIRQEVDLIQDPAINAYVRDLGTRIAAAIDSPNSQFRFFVVDDPRINAFAMPGGYVGVHSGLITASRTESELGAVIAHELSHVTQRHIARRVAAAQGINLRTTAMVLAGLLISSQNPQAGMAAATSGMASGIDSQLAYSRDHEREADRVGMRILARARLDPMGMPDFFRVLMDDSRYRSKPPAFLSTHPLTEARIADASSIAAQLRGEDIFESPGYAYARARTQVLTTDNTREALADFRARYEADNRADTRYALAMALTRQNQTEPAREHYQSLIAEYGEQPLLHLGLAEAALAAENPEAALAELQRGLGLFPGSVALQFGKVEVYLRTDRPGQALAVTRELTYAADGAPDIWALHARAASAAGDSAESAIAMAQYYAVQGDLEAGLSQLRRVDRLTATPNQSARANALRERWESRLSTTG